MAMLAWVMMGLALWHFTIWLPDRSWGGIVGAFVGALIGSALFGSYATSVIDKLTTVGTQQDLGDQLTKFTTEIGFKGFQNSDEVGAAAVDYLRVCGHLVFAYFFARMAKVALDNKDSGDKFYQAKLTTARFYFAKLLPETAGLTADGVTP